MKDLFNFSDCIMKSTTGEFIRLLSPTEYKDLTGNDFDAILLQNHFGLHGDCEMSRYLIAYAHAIIFEEHDAFLRITVPHVVKYPQAYMLIESLNKTTSQIHETLIIRSTFEQKCSKIF